MNVTPENLLLECQDVTRVFPKRNPPVTAVNNVSLKVSRGDFLVIVGRSGAGKSTLLNLIGALDRPTSGTVLIDDKPLDNMSDKDLARFRMKNIGFIFQDFNLLPAYTAFENIEIALIPNRLPKTERRDRVESLLHASGLADRADHLPLEMSVGEQQKLAIARALANNPPLILADEPTGAVDPMTAKETVDRLLELNHKRNVTLVVTTHGIFPYHLVNQALYMKNGGIVSKDEAGY
jgi:putative ABC transport system ATP-binding protein